MSVLDNEKLQNNEYFQANIAEPAKAGNMYALAVVNALEKFAAIANIEPIDHAAVSVALNEYAEACAALQKSRE